MKKLTATAALALAMIAIPAHAEDRAGTVQARLFVTGVLPDGKIDKVKFDGLGLPANTQTKANNNVVPTLAIEYFFTNNFSVETICCVTEHHVNGTRAMEGTRLVSNATLIPATFTAKYHFDVAGTKPYVGAGPAYFIWTGEDPGSTTVALGATKQRLSDELGLALQAGIDMPLNDKFSISLDAKRYFIDTTARWYAGNTKVLETKHKLDPWVLSAGVGYRF